MVSHLTKSSGQSLGKEDFVYVHSLLNKKAILADFLVLCLLLLYNHCNGHI